MGKSFTHFNSELYSVFDFQGPSAPRRKTKSDGSQLHALHKNITLTDRKCPSQFGSIHIFYFKQSYSHFTSRTTKHLGMSSFFPKLCSLQQTQNFVVFICCQRDMAQLIYAGSKLQAIFTYILDLKLLDDLLGFSLLGHPLL